MENLLVTCDIVLPLFLIMVIGYCMKRFNLVKDEVVKGCNKLVFKLFLPMSLVKSIMNADKSNIQGEVPGLMLFIAVAVTATFAVAMWIVPIFIKDRRRAAVMVQAIFRSNYAILGIPLTEQLFPQGDGGVAAMVALITVPVFNTLAVVTLEIFKEGETKINVKRILIGVLKNPLIEACIIGFVLLISGITLPSFLSSTINKLAAVASPLALFTLGASIMLNRIKGNAKELIVTVLCRLIVVPGLLLTVAYLIGYRGPAFASLMIAFGTPVAVSSFPMSVEMGADSELCAQQVALTTTLSCFTIFGMVFLFKALGIF